MMLIIVMFVEYYHARDVQKVLSGNFQWQMTMSGFAENVI